MEANNKVLREAVQFCVKQMTDAIFDKDFGDDTLYLVGCMKVCIDRMKSALSAPARNCDVGTAEEQWGRYCKFTERYNPCSYRGNVRCAEDCPIHIKLKREGLGELLCQLEWAQMPYEEGGAE